MADPVRAEHLPHDTRVHDADVLVTKVDDNRWHAVGSGVDRWLCDRQVDYLLDTGATVAGDAPRQDSSQTR